MQGPGPACFTRLHTPPLSSPQSPTSTSLTPQETALLKNPIKDSKPFNARSNVVPIETNWIGVFLFLSFCSSGFYYFYVRATRTMDIGWTW